MKKSAQIILILLFSLSLVFHLLVVLKVIPWAIVWGGRLESDTDMYRFEAVSIFVNILSLLVLLFNAGVFRPIIPKSIITGALWVMFGLMALNTVGNLFSGNHLEKIIFTPITLISAILLLVILLKKS
ncbi:MAG: hypothetical protein ACOYNC_05100 [Bacteroidales bacterium]